MIHYGYKTHTYTQIYTHEIHTYTHTYMDTHMHTHMHAYVHRYIQIHIHTCMHTYIHTYKYIHTYVHTYIHAYIHTHIFSMPLVVGFCFVLFCLFVCFSPLRGFNTVLCSSVYQTTRNIPPSYHSYDCRIPVHRRGEYDTEPLIGCKLTMGCVYKIFIK